MADRIDKTIIRLQADEQSAKRLVARIGEVRAAMSATATAVKETSIGAGRVERAFADYGKAAQSAGRRIDGLNEMMDALRRETLDAAEAQDRLERSMRGVGDAAKVQDRTLRDAREGAMIYGDVESRTRAITGAIGYIGGGAGTGVERTINVGAEVLAAIEGIKLLRLELPKLAASAGLTTASIAPLGVALAAVAAAGAAYLIISRDTKRATEEQADALAAWRGSLEEVTRLLLQGTTEDLEAAIEAKQEELQVAQAQRDELARVQAELEARARNVYIDLTKPLGPEFLGLFTDIGDEYKKNTEALKEAEANVDELTFAIDRLSAGLDAGATVASDIAAREEAAAERRKAAAQEALAAVDQQIQDEIALRRKVASYTPEQVDSEAQALRSQIAAYNEGFRALQEQQQSGIITMAEMRDKEAELRAERDRVVADLNALDTTVRAAASRRQQAADAEKRLEDATRDAEKAINDLSSAERSRSALLTSYASETAEVNRRRLVDDMREAEDFARQQARAQAKHNADLIALDRKYLQDREKAIASIAEEMGAADTEAVQALRDFQRDEKRATVAYWRDIRRINRDERTSVIQAAARLDASAVLAAQQAAKQQREERTEQFEDERQARKEDYDERLRELDEQREEKRQAAAQELRDLDAKHRQERQDRIMAYNQARADEEADRRVRRQRLQEDRTYEDTLRQQQFDSELASILDLITAAEQLERQARAVVQAGGAYPTQAGGGGSVGGTQQYYQSLQQSAAQGRYVTWAGQRVRTDMYDPLASGGMTAAEWYTWKRRYGLQRGGVAYPGRDYLVGERGAEWVRFMQPATVYPHGVTPPSGGNTTTTGDLTFNIYESGNPQRTAEVVTQYINELLGA